MRYIHLRQVQTQLPIHNSGVPRLDAEGHQVYAHVSFHAQIQELMRTAADAQRGLDADEMRRNIRVLEALQPLKDGDVLELEDADYDHLRLRVSKMRFPFADVAFVAFVEAVNDPHLTKPLELTSPQVPTENGKGQTALVGQPE